MKHLIGILFVFVVPQYLDASIHLLQEPQYESPKTENKWKQMLHQYVHGQPCGFNIWYINAGVDIKKNKQITHPLFLKMLSQEQRSLRELKVIVSWLGRVAPHGDPLTRKLLIKKMKGSSDISFIAIVLEALEKTGTSEDVPEILPYLKHRNEGLRIVTCRAFAKLATLNDLPQFEKVIAVRKKGLTAKEIENDYTFRESDKAIAGIKARAGQTPPQPEKKTVEPPKTGQSKTTSPIVAPKPEATPKDAASSVSMYWYLGGAGLVVILLVTGIWWTRR